ncbi:hypothetical protein GHT06_016796 [Daphnia sinensis]|uniref:MACPF domain-containing protein n=1 Tax=Daphnia sinensis TaxID=1820382 RepID=A0AAD5KQR6_9CRUS|nr:hypothetical protein GHT06_016796 [Daphnia sinensis]
MQNTTTARTLVYPGKYCFSIPNPMIEETEQISFQIPDVSSGEAEESSDHGTRSLLDINNHKTNACVTPAEQSSNETSKMNSSSTFSNNRDDLGLGNQECPATLKRNASSTSARVEEHRLIIKRAVFLWSSFICFVFLVGAISLGVIIWNKNQTTIRNLARPSPELQTRSWPKPVPDLFCHNRSTVDFLSDLFMAGYDITRTNPFRKTIYGRPLLEPTLLRECHVTPDPQRCQPYVESVVIDSLIAYQHWASRYITFSAAKADELDESVLIAALSSAQDSDLLSIQAALMSGNLIIMTHIKCPHVNASRTGAPIIMAEYAHRLRLMMHSTSEEEEEMVELAEDIGAHFVDRVILGTEVIIRFTLSRKTVDFFKRKNLSFDAQATASGLYILSRNNISLNISKTNQKIARDFVAAAQMQIYSGTALSAPLSDLQTADHWVRSAMKHSTVISLQLKPMEQLFTQLFQNNTKKILDNWQLSRKRICHQFLSLALNGKCGNTNNNSSKSVRRQMEESNHPDNEQFSNVFVLPLLQIWTNRSTVCLRTSWNHCLELCRKDPLCSAATVCLTSNAAVYQSKDTKTVSSCPAEFRNCNCALHRQQDFSHGIISPRVITLIPARQDLRPVTLRGFAVYGQTLFSVDRMTDVASCARLCSRTAACQIASFSQYDLGQHKVCKLFSNMTGNELRRKGRAITVFMMATFTPCFAGEIESGRASCPTNTNCSSFYGMCVCMPGYFKNGSTCFSRNHEYQFEADDGLQKALHETNGDFNRKHQEPDQIHRNYQNSSFWNKASTQDATLWSNDHKVKANVSSAFHVSTTASYTPITTGIMQMATAGPSGSEIQTTANQQDQVSNTEGPTGVIALVTVAPHRDPHKDKRTYSTVHSKSSYVPWQMRSWNRASTAWQ